MNDKIREAAERFAQELAAIIAEEIQTSLGDVGRRQAATIKARPAPLAQERPASAKKKNAKKKSEKNMYRSSEELDDVKQTVVQVLRRNRRGLRMEELALLTDMVTKDLRRPLKQMCADGAVRTSGATRATVYVLR